MAPKESRTYISNPPSGYETKLTHTNREREREGGGYYWPNVSKEPVLPVKLMGWIGFSSTHSRLIHW